LASKLQDEEPVSQRGPQKENLPLGKNIGIFYLLHMIKFGNFEFIFAIKGPILGNRGGDHRINTAQNRDFFLTEHKIHHALM